VSYTTSDVINSIFENGVVDSVAAREYLGRALSFHSGRPLDPETVMESLLSESAWTHEAQERIRSVLRSFEGEVLSNGRSSVTDRIRETILQDTDRWALSDAQKQEIVSDNNLMRRWTNEYSEHDGFNYLLEYVIDDEIFVWKSEHAQKQSLDEMIAAVQNRQMSVYLTPNNDRTWSASIDSSPSHSNSVLLTAVKDFPVQVYFSRTDLNGSSVMEAETCSDKNDLLYLMNWIGKCGFLPEEFWDFNIEKVQNQELIAVLSDSQNRRYEMIQKEQEKMVDYFSLPEKSSKSSFSEPER